MKKLVLVVAMGLIGCESPTAVDKCPGLIEVFSIGRMPPSPIIITPDSPPPPTLTYGVTFSVKGSNGCEEQTVTGFARAETAVGWFYHNYPAYRP